MSCPIALSLEEVGEAWSLLILRDVFMGVRRFHDLELRLGISASTLTRRLAELCRKGLLHATLYEQKPKRYEYTLTDKGEDLLEVLLALGAWGNRWLTQVIVPVDANTGARVDPVLVDRVTGRRLSAGQVALAAGRDASSKMREFLKPPRKLGRCAPTLVLEASS
ncbi:MAG TPA: helix-turn-helix domain-containing protein [Polyangiaceae bacterium]|nr:helix-turn-helix domain-containing protein [Polyangiaceae bacterium]